MDNLGNKFRMSPQCKTVLKHLYEIGSISGVEAAAIYKIRALPRRIKDLTEYNGVQVRAEMKADATGQRYTRYHYEFAPSLLLHAAGC